VDVSKDIPLPPLPKISEEKDKKKEEDSAK
jgi:hypothetical protein